MLKKYLNLYLLIFTIPLIVNIFGFNIYSVGKASLFLLILGIIGFLFAIFIFNKKHINIYFNKTLNIYFLILIFSLSISSLISVATIQSTFGLYKDFIGLIFYLLIIVHFFICLNLFKNKKITEYFFILTKTITVIICGLAILQLFNIDPFVDIDNQEFLFRVYSTIGQPNFLGQFLIFPFFIIFFSITNFYKNKKYKSLILNSLLLLAILIIIYFTKNRATWLAMSISLFFYLILFLDIKTIYKKISILSCFILGFALYQIFGIDLRSLYSRSYLLDGSLEIMNSKNILFGNGLNSFYQKFVQIMPKEVFEYEKFYTIPLHPHNEIMETLIERGALGVILYLIPILILIYYLIKKPKDYFSLVTLFGLLTYYISVQFSFSKIEHFVYIAAFWAIFLLNNIKFKLKKIDLQNVFKKSTVLIISFSFACTLLFSSYSLIKSDILLKQSMNDYIDNKISESISKINDAIKHAPYFVYIRKLFINVYLSEISEYPNLKINIDKNLKAIGNISSGDIDYNILSLKYASQYNDLDKINYHFKEGKKIAPNLPLLYTEAISAYYKQGQCEKALINYNKLLSLAPDFYRKNINNCNSNYKCRIFLKHATFLYDISNKMQNCKYNIF